MAPPSCSGFLRFHWHHTLLFAVLCCWHLHGPSCSLLMSNSFMEAHVLFSLCQSPSKYQFPGFCLTQFFRAISFRSTTEVGETPWGFWEGYSCTYEPSHFYPAAKYNFTVFPTSTCLVVCKKICILSQQGKQKTNLQRKKSSGMRHENHMDFFSLLPNFASFIFAPYFVSAYQKYRVGERT